MSIIELKKGDSNNFASTIIIDHDRGIVEKIVDYEPYTKELFEREVYWLSKLHKTGITPKLKGYNPKTFTITMSWCGEVLCNDNKPIDAFEQLYNIHIVLLQHHCFYNDWKWGNFLVKDGKITIIDFGWCPKVIEDYTCGDTLESDIEEKPAGNYYQDIFTKKDERCPK
jgi:hypothetical protein